jgi:hypothetical protein
MLSHAAPVGASFSDNERRGPASLIVEALPGAHRWCTSRLGEAFENVLDQQMTTALRCHVKRFNGW